MRNFNLGLIREAYEKGQNITQLLRNEGSEVNTLDAIELAYDLQAGSYARGALDDVSQFLRRTEEMGEILSAHISFLDVIIDCGTGELTTLSGVSRCFPNNVKLLAFDLSLSRLNAGLRFASRAMRNDLLSGLNVFAASIDRIPLPDESVDVVTTSHALEPNFGRELELLTEMLRISRNKLVLFEPSYEDNTDEGRERMQRLGYVRDLPKYIDLAGGRLVEKFALQNCVNPLNPTYCYVVEKNKVHPKADISDTYFKCPVTGEVLQNRQGYLWSKSGGYAYPLINGIPLLRGKDAILMCHE